VLLDDETLRDGLQSPTVSDPAIADKIQLLHLMEELGIQMLDIGLPGAGPRAYADTLALAQEIARSRLKIRPNCAARTTIQDIDPILDIADKTGVTIDAATFLGSSMIRQYVENWTMDDLLRYATQLTKRAGGEVTTYGLMTQVDNFEQTVAWIRRWNAEFWEPVVAGKKVLLDSAPAAAAYKWLYDAYKGGIINPRFDYADFGAGKVAMVAHRLAGERATIAKAVGESFKWTWQFMPKGAGGRQGGYLSIDTEQLTSTSKAPDQAWEVLKWITDKESGVQYALQSQGSLTPGFRKDSYCSDELLNDPRFPKSGMKANCDNIDNPESYTYPHNFRLTQDGAIQPTVNKYLNDIADLKQEPTPAIMRELTSEIQKILDMPRL
jgi:hypothetical protein